MTSLIRNFILILVVIAASCQPKSQTEIPSAYKVLVEGLTMSGNWKEATILLDELLKAGTQTEDSLYCLLYLGENARYLEQYTDSENYFKQVIDHPASVRFPLYRGEAFYGLGDLYYLKWNYFREEDALAQTRSFLDSSLACSQKHNLLSLTSKNFYRMGTLWQIEDATDSARRYFREGLDISFAISDTVGIIRNDAHTARELINTGRIDSAFYHYHRAYDYAKKLNRNYSETHALCNLGSLHLQTGSEALARQCFVRAQILAEELDQGILLCRTSYSLAKLESSQGNMTDAIKWLENGYRVALEKGYQNYGQAFLSLARDAGIDEVLSD